MISPITNTGSGILCTDFYVSLLFLIIFTVGMFSVEDWDPISSVFPKIICGAGIIFSILVIFSNIFVYKPENNTTIHFSHATPFFGWLSLFLILTYVIGFLPAILIYMTGHIKYSGEKWSTTLYISTTFIIISYIVFHHIFNTGWPISQLGLLFPILKSNQMWDVF